MSIFHPEEEKNTLKGLSLKNENDPLDLLTLEPSDFLSDENI